MELHNQTLEVNVHLIFAQFLSKYDWNSFRRYDYITRTCLGEMTGEILVGEVLAMIRSLDAPALEPLWEAGKEGLPGEAREPWLGEGWQDLDALEKASAVEGVRVMDLAPRGPAERAGLRRGDLVTQWNGLSVSDRERFMERLNGVRVGDKVSLRVWRAGEWREYEVEVGARSSYFWQDWQPGLPSLRGEEDLREVFDDSEAELEALKKRFESLKKQEGDVAEPRGQ